jgi:hypothetical protein
MARRPASESTTVGSPQGVHQPGILPEPAVVEEAEGEPHPGERLVLEDLADALPSEDRDTDVAPEGVAEPVELPRERLQFRSFGIVLPLTVLAIGLVGTALSMLAMGHPLLGAAFAVVGCLCGAGAARAVGQARRPR